MIKYANHEFHPQYSRWIAITVKEYYDHFYKEEGRFYRHPDDDDMTVITGIDRFVRLARVYDQYIIEFGRTGEKTVDEDFIVFVQTKVYMASEHDTKAYEKGN